MGSEVTFADYADAFPNIAMTRDDGVLEVRLHTDGSSLQWSDAADTDLGRAFRVIASDPDNAVVVVTGTGEVFCAASAPDAFQLDPSVPPVGIDRIYQEGKDLLPEPARRRRPDGCCDQWSGVDPCRARIVVRRGHCVRDHDLP